MEPEILSSSQSLRVIGQYLRGLNIDSFELGKIGGNYVVSFDRNKFNLEVAIGQNGIQKTEMANGSNANSLQFNYSEIFRSEIQRRLRRGDIGGMPDARSLGLQMRVLGQYLDLKGAADFGIFWSAESVKIRFLEKEQSFSFSNLYELSICMYLKRSNNSLPAIADRLAI